MAIIDHGQWQRYEPEVRPAHLPASIMFCRRIGDGVDWYEYQKSSPFSEGSVFFVVHQGRIKVATDDPSRLFPQGMHLFEETAPLPGDPQTIYGEQLFGADNRVVPGDTADESFTWGESMRKTLH